MTGFGLKIVALISMLCDHSGLIFLRNPSYLNIIGRISFPIFASQISEGYVHTKNLKKYISRLAWFAIISQIPFMLYLKSVELEIYKLNVFFTLLLGLSSITIYDKIKNKYNNIFLGFLPVILFIFLGHICNCDYGWYGVTLIFMFYLFKDNKILMNESVIWAMFLKYLTNYISSPNIFHLYLFLGAISSLLLINFYNNKKGKNIKYLLYIFYPLHLIVLYLLKVYIL